MISLESTVWAETAAYELILARSDEDVRAAQRLRFAVFNEELGEGLAESAAHGLDIDAFDAVCDHLLVRCKLTSAVVGTYRLQTGLRARSGLGLYSAGEFDLSGWTDRAAELVELGRACVAAGHRNWTVLSLLWRGIGRYAVRAGARYLVGCSSLQSLQPRDGSALYAELKTRYAAPTRWQAEPWARLRCERDRGGSAPPIPRLLEAYLRVGARVCGPPALDRDFGTIDFLTWLDLDGLEPGARRKFVGTSD